MGINFILGPAGSGKTRACFEGLRQWVAGSSVGPAGILLVPEQATHQTERELTLPDGLHAPILPSPRAHVLSFQRLAVRVFAEVGGAARPRLDDLGRQLVLRALLELGKPQLKALGKLADRPGFLELLGQSLREFRAHRQGPDQLEQLALALGPGLLADKLHDAAWVMRALESHLEGRFVDPDLTLTLLAARLGPSQLVNGARIWVDGFFGFTPQELRVLRALAERADTVHVALCLDDREGLESYPDNALFRPTLDTYHQLRELAVKHGLAFSESRLWDNGASCRRFRAPELVHLERTVAHQPAVPLRRQETSGGEAQAVTLVRARDRRSEIEATAVEILRLCREEGYRFRDIAVVTRDLEAYHDLAEALFEEFGIPRFIDRRRSVAHHPAIELVRSALEVVTRNWPFEAVMRYLKTDLAPVSRSEVDRLENAALEHGIKGRRWLDPFPGSEPARPARQGISPAPEPGMSDADPRTREDRLEGIRQRAVAALQAFAARFGRASTIRDGCAAVFALLEDVNVGGRLLAWASASEDEGDRLAASEHEQVYDGLLNLLDQTVVALGMQPLEGRTFTAILEAGLSHLQLGLVPPTCDQVLFGSIERSRHPEIRALFIVGAQQGTFPRAPVQNPLLDDTDRQAIASLPGQGHDPGRGTGQDHSSEAEPRTGPSSRTLLFHERYLLYIAATRASERLYVSYPLTDAEGRGLQPSLLFSQIAAALPDALVRDLSIDPPGFEAIVSASQLASALAEGLGANKDPRWAAIRSWAEADPAVCDLIRPALTALRPREADAPLPDALARASLLRSLQGSAGPASAPPPAERTPERYLTSISRLETFAACPFFHFARHGLRLTPRRTYRLEVSEVGVLAHAALKELIEQLRQEGRDWADLPAEEEASRTATIVAELSKGLKGAILLDSGRNRHVLAQITRILQEAVQALGQHDRHGRFRALALEVPFGPDTPLGPLDVELADGAIVSLQGQIDRLDVAELAGSRFVRVLDYKLSGRRLVVGEVALGLTLQLPIYLAVARLRGGVLLAEANAGTEANAEAEAGTAIEAPTTRLEPAGMLYFPIQGKWVEAPVDADEALAERFKSHRARGLLIAEESVIRLMEEDAIGASNLLEAYWKTDGKLSDSRSRIAPASRLTALESQALGKVATYMDRIRSGEVAAAPYRIGADRTPCTYCDYRSVCRFDPTAGDRPRPLTVPDDETAWQLMGAPEPELTPTIST